MPPCSSNSGCGFVVFARMFEVVVVTESSNTSGGCGFVGPLSYCPMTSFLIITATPLIMKRTYLVVLQDKLYIPSSPPSLPPSSFPLPSSLPPSLSSSLPLPSSLSVCCVQDLVREIGPQGREKTERHTGEIVSTHWLLQVLDLQPFLPPNSQ